MKKISNTKTIKKINFSKLNNRTLTNNKLKNNKSNTSKSKLNKEDLEERKKFKKYVNYELKNKRILLECVKKYGSPLYVLNETYLIERTKNLINAFKERENTQIFYAFKSNDLPYMINILKKNGLKADVAGEFELMLALKLNFDKIIFTGPFRTEEEINLCIKNSNKVILNIDNFDELDLVLQKIKKQKIKNKLKISFRLNLNKNNEEWGKFGLRLDELKQAVNKVSESKYANWEGIHFHSSWNKDPTKYVKNIKIVSNYLEKNFSKEELLSLSFVDVGGGFHPEGFGDIINESNSKNKLNKIKEIQVKDIKFFAKEIINAIENSIFSTNKLNLKLYIEPGRYISSVPTSILLKVLSIKKDNIYVDGGINLLGSSNFDFEYVPVVNLTNPSNTKINKSKIYGPLCDPDDHWGDEYFGEKINKGDILSVLHQGAYTFSTAWRWQKPTSKYISFNKNKIKLIKGVEDFNDRYSKCIFK